MEEGSALLEGVLVQWKVKWRRQVEGSSRIEAVRLIVLHVRHILFRKSGWIWEISSKLNWSV